MMVSSGRSHLENNGQLQNLLRTEMRIQKNLSHAIHEQVQELGHIQEK
jgi:hypothetical protein